jgi:hypothetical protein
VRTWQQADPGVSLLPLVAAAEAVTVPVAIFDANDQRFMEPGDMPTRIAAWCTEHGQPVPATRAEFVRSIIESLAEAFARAVPGFTFHPCLSRTPRAVPRPHDRNGRAQVALGELGPNAATDIAYLCGNPNMVDEAFAMLKEAGLPVPHIRREKYVSSR